MEKKKEQMHVLDLDMKHEIKWATSELVNMEKHLYDALQEISEKLKKNPEKKSLEVAFESLSKLLNEIRIHRSMHLNKFIEDIEKGLDFKGVWCMLKHSFGGMHQFCEVGAKALYIGDYEYAKKCFLTAKLCSEIPLFLERIAKEVKKLEKGEAECSEKISDRTAEGSKLTE